YQQIYESLRLSILSGGIAPRTQVPPTRVLAGELGISRTTVVNAYDQLLAEGYLEGKTGAGTYVVSEMPDATFQLEATVLADGKERAKRRERALSRRGQWIASSSVKSLRMQADNTCLAFQNGVPAGDAVPFRVWWKLASRRWRNPPRELLGYGDPAGYRPLREAIAEHLRSARAVHCDADQVIIVAGRQQPIYLIARLLLEPGDRVWVEDPCYPGARNALLSAGSKVISVPVDEEGFDLGQALQLSKKARLVYVTPSHQFPLGVTMSLSRRLALLEWAQRAGAWVLEDDYDSEYRYNGRPLPALQGLDIENRTVYIGTLSKTLFPSLRLGYLVVPPDLVDAF